MVGLRCTTPSGERTYLLHEWPLSLCTENLFLVKATMVGAEVVFKGEVCQVFMSNEVVVRAEETADASSLFANRGPRGRRHACL